MFEAASNPEYGRSVKYGIQTHLTDPVAESLEDFFLGNSRGTSIKRGTM